MAPEVLKNKTLSKSSDVWSAAVVIYVLFQGKFPFEGEIDYDILQAIKAMDWSKEFSKAKWSHVSPEAKSFLQHCFKYDPNHRPSCAAMLKHPWLKNM